MPPLCLSALAHTWVLDFDGTLVRHNGHKRGEDEWLPGALEFLRSIPEGDLVILLTAREEAYRERTEAFIRAAGVRVDYIHFNGAFSSTTRSPPDSPARTPWRRRGTKGSKA